MRFYEMVTLPRIAGTAALEYEECRGNMMPFRNGDHIHLPKCLDAEFFPLMDKRQFLLRHWVANEPQIWFGGTDEQPFFVRLNPNAFSAYEQGREDGFFASFKPFPTIHAEKELQTKAIRQGDIFVVRLALTWREVMRGMGRDNFAGPDAHWGPIFGTRHWIKGVNALSLSLAPNQLIATGTLEAPDHRPISLNLPTLLSQAANLYNPQQAD